MYLNSIIGTNGIMLLNTHTPFLRFSYIQPPFLNSTLPKNIMKIQKLIYWWLFKMHLNRDYTMPKEEITEAIILFCIFLFVYLSVSRNMLVDGSLEHKKTRHSFHILKIYIVMVIFLSFPSLSLYWPQITSFWPKDLIWQLIWLRSSWD